MGKVKCVKCSECGFLSLRKPETGELCEAEIDYREMGVAPSSRNINNYPVCFVRAANLTAEYEELRKQPGGYDKDKGRAKVIQDDRECVKFTDWHQGYSPKEHLEMLIEEAQRRSEERRDERQRQWQADESKKADERHRDSLKVAIDAGKTNWVSQVAVGALSALVTLLAVWVASKLNPATVINVQPAPVLLPPAAINPTTIEPQPIPPTVEPPAKDNAKPADDAKATDC